MTETAAEPAWDRGRGRALAELLGVAAFFAADGAGWIPFSKTPFMVLFIWGMLSLRRSRWRAIGLALPSRAWKSVTLGVVLGVALEAFATIVTTPLLTRLTGHPPDLEDLRVVVGNPAMLALFLTLNWTLAAFGEEVVYRGYVTERLRAVFRGVRAAPALSVLSASVVFAFAHGYQGTSGVLQEGLSGLLLGLIVVGAHGNLLTAIIAHGVSNTVAFVLIFFGRYPGVG